VKTAHHIAQLLFESSIRMATIEDSSMLLCLAFDAQIARLYLDNRQIPTEVEVRSDQATQLGPEQAYYRAGWHVMTSDDDFMRDIDAELWAIQEQHVAEQRAESRGALLREQAA
jgi:hypothetical protein